MDFLKSFCVLGLKMERVTYHMSRGDAFSKK